MIHQTEYADRREHVAAALAEHRVQALIVSALPNIRYLTGFTGSNALLLLAPGTATLFTDPRYTFQAAEETSGCKVVIAKRGLHQTAMRSLARRRWKRVGVERGRISLAAYTELQENAPSGLFLLPVGGLIEAERTVKSDAEIALIRQSVLTNSRAFEKTLARLKPEWTENRTAAEIEYQMRLFGAEGAAFESIVAAGARSALPHARPTGEKLGTDRLLLFDVGALQNGYSSDMSRVVHLGKPGRKARSLYRAVLEAQLAGIDAVRENATAQSVDAAARRVLKAHGLAEFFMHSTGHGLGLEIHESPRLGKRDKTRLKAGMVVTVEPGAYLEGFGGVRIEDTVAVTRTGCEILTPTSKDLVAI